MQKHLLALYGGEVCILDATYQTCDFDLPLFMLCVATNTGFVVVGAFILQDETSDQIKDGLQVLKDWNPGWDPSHFMVDNSERQITAIEEIFRGKSNFKMKVKQKP